MVVRWPGKVPAGETYVIPLEGTAEGTLAAPVGWYPYLTEDMTFRFEKGAVVELTGRDIVRHRLVRQIVEAYETFGKNSKPADEKPEGK